VIYCRTLHYAHHIFLRHPEVDQFDIDRCVRSLDECYFDNSTHYYILVKKLGSKWICCVIDKLDDECVVASAWYMSNKKKARYVYGKLVRGEWSTI